MSFRNPTTSLPATSITPGALPTGVTMPADGLTTGSLTSTYTITGAIQTAATGARVVIANTGIYAYAASGQQTLGIDSATGNIVIVGSFSNGIPGTQHVEISTTNVNQILFYSGNAGEAAPAFVDVDPSGDIYIETARFSTDPAGPPQVVLMLDRVNTQFIADAYRHVFRGVAATGVPCNNIELATDTLNIGTGAYLGAGNVNVKGTLTVNGVVYNANPACSRYNSAANNTPSSTNSLMPFDSFSITTGNMAATAGRITIAVPGVYWVRGNASFSANATGIRQCFVRKNGTTLVTPYGNRSAVAVGTNEAVDTQGLVTLAAGDYLELITFQTSGAPLNVLGGSSATVLEAFFIRS